MDEYRKNFNVFQQIESVKQILAPAVPTGESFRLRGLVMRCVKFKKKLITKLDKDSTTVYDLLLKNGLNPQTVYEWLLLENVPAHIREKLVQRKLTLKDARIEFIRWKRHSDGRAGNEIMDEIKNIIRRLKWKSQEESHKPI